MIDEKLQAQLRAKYNPDGSLLRQHQLRMVEMLKYFDDLCQKHGIKYWLSSGNCLGLVRHGGFIPWDDDLDVEMLRKDYLKLGKIFEETDDYIFQTWKNDKKYFWAFGKMRDKHSYIDEGKLYDELYEYRGVYIDVFCLEKSNGLVHRICASILMRTFYKYQDKSYFQLVKRIGFKFVSLCRFLSRIVPNNKLRHTYGCIWHSNLRDLKDIFPLKRAKFEGVELNVPNNMDGYLKKIYGDYMLVPSEEKRRKPHVIKLNLSL